MTPTAFRAARERLGWSRQWLAEALGYRDGGSVQQIEQGEQRMPEAAAAWLERWERRIKRDPPPRVAGTWSRAGRRPDGGQPEPAQGDPEGEGPLEPGLSAEPVQRAQEPVAEPSDPAAFSIEIDRGLGWSVRAEGRIGGALTREAIERALPGYCQQYPHRLVIGGRVVAEGRPAR